MKSRKSRRAANKHRSQATELPLKQRTASNELRPLRPAYIGRFAPSPTGPVHFGTLIAAVGSYLQACKHHGAWLVRIEDVDTTRRVAGADTAILQTLEAFGFEWQGEVVYQSQRGEHYRQALRTLLRQNLVFACNCSRKQLVGQRIYPGACRQRRLPADAEPTLPGHAPPDHAPNDHALRLRVDDAEIEFDDLVQGRRRENLARECGDFIIKRRDGLFAYQLAVVVDDALQGVTEIVRGADLLDSTARQIYLQQKLGYATPQYAHLPLAVDRRGNKLSKSEGAGQVAVTQKETLLLRALAFLGQQPPAELAGSSIEDIWRWARAHWDIDKVPRQSRIQL